MIHRTRDGAAPSGGPEPGRQIVRIGNVFVEYSGPVPDAAELDAHLRPPRPPPHPLSNANSVPVLRDDFNALVALLRTQNTIP